VRCVAHPALARSSLPAHVAGHADRRFLIRRASTTRCDRSPVASRSLDVATPRGVRFRAGFDSGASCDVRGNRLTSTRADAEPVRTLASSADCGGWSAGWRSSIGSELAWRARLAERGWRLGSSTSTRVCGARGSLALRHGQGPGGSVEAGEGEAAKSSPGDSLARALAAVRVGSPSARSLLEEAWRTRPSAKLAEVIASVPGARRSYRACAARRWSRSTRGRRSRSAQLTELSTARETAERRRSKRRAARGRGR
jgi:hypothetical protein